MNNSCWFVELVLPDGTFESRGVVTEHTDAELDLDVRTSVAELLAWKQNKPASAEEICPASVAPGYSSPPCRLIMAHCDDPGHARRIAKDLQTLLPRPSPPWNGIVHEEFMHYLREFGSGRS